MSCWKFFFRIESPLAQLYSTSTLERHHFDRFRVIISEGDCNILSNLNAQDFDTVINQVKHAIISTDLAVYFKTRGQFFDAVQSNTFDIKNSKHCKLLCSMLMTASDLGAITRPWNVEYQVSSRLICLEIGLLIIPVKERLVSDTKLMQDLITRLRSNEVFFSTWKYF